MPTAPVLLAVGLFAGAATGVAAQAAGFSPIPEPDEVAAVEESGVVLGPAVTVHDCPDGVPIAVLAGGDGVLATGRTEDGLWIEIRSPLDLTAPAWMSAGTLDPDGDLADLPVHECAVEVTTTTTGSTTTVPGATTTTSTSTTSTTAPGQPPTTAPPVTVPPTQPTPPPTAPDEPPRLRRPAATPSTIATRTSTGGTTCSNPSLPTSAQVAVSASDDRPGLEVAMTFRLLQNGNEVFAGTLDVGGPVNGCIGRPSLFLTRPSQQSARTRPP